MGIGAVRAALMVAAVVAFFYAVPAASSQPPVHGRELVAQFQLPSETVARYAALAAAASRGEAPKERTAAPDNAMWVGPLQQVGAGRNPYKLVMTVRGVARNAGDVRAHWQAGWEVRESPQATREVLMPAGAQLSGETAAGAPVTLTAVSAPLTFRGERQVSPMLNLLHASNLDIEDVELQVWSGSAPLMIWPMLSAPRPALLGLGTLCLLLWFFLRGTTGPAAAPAAPMSRLPQTDLQQLLEQPACAPTPAKETTPMLPPQNQDLRVASALRDVLMKGLVVPTELDDTRRRRGGRGAG